MTSVKPNARALRQIVPTLPGSATASRIIIRLLLIGASIFFLHIATIPSGDFELVNLAIILSLTK